MRRFGGRIILVGGRLAVEQPLCAVRQREPGQFQLQFDASTISHAPQAGDLGFQIASSRDDDAIRRRYRENGFQICIPVWSGAANCNCRKKLNGNAFPLRNAEFRDAIWRNGFSPFELMLIGGKAQTQYERGRGGFPSHSLSMVTSNATVTNVKWKHA